MADLKDTYVVHGAWTTCTCGMRKSRIVLEKSHGIFLKNRELMTVNDCKPENIICFGGCYSMENPDTAAEAQKIQMAVEKDCPNTFTDTVMNFFTKKGQKESSDAPLQVVGICNPKIISAEWDNGGNTVEVNGEVPLLGGAKVHCLYGGEIEIIDSGQPEAGDMSQVEISPHSVPLSGSPGSNAESAAMGAAAAGIAATPGMPKQVAAGMIGASKASSYGKSETIDVEGPRVTNLDSTGYNMIANMERNLSLIEYDEKTGLITSIPTNSTDVGYGHDYIKNPLPSVPTSMTASGAYELLKNDLNGIDSDGKVVKHKDYIGAIAGIDAELTQDQFNALVGLRYNIGSLGVVDGLLEYLEKGFYERTKLKNLINSYYDAIIKSVPANEKYRDGWYNRTEMMLNIFFDGNYGYMPIDAVNGKVILK
ncbi:MAG: PAAR-like protein [Lacrimispora sphenoides]